MRRSAALAWYRFRATLRHRLGGYLALAVLVGLIGGTAMASMTAARRTRRQLAGTIAWQSTVVAVVGLVIGVPLGIAAGRWLWILFARELSAVPDPVIPAASVALAALAALILANLVAALPGRQAARTPAALLLRAE